MPNPVAQPKTPTAAPAPTAPAEGEKRIVEGVDLTGIKLFTDEPTDEPKEAPAAEGEAQGEGEGEGEAQGEGEPAAPVKPKLVEKPKSEQFVQLSRLERQNREMKAELEKLKAQPKSEITLENFWDEATKRGIDPQKAIDALVARKDPPKAKTPAELEAEKLKKDVEELRAREQAREQADRVAKAKAAESDAKGTLRKDFEEQREDLPFVNAYAEDAADTIWAAMQTHYQQTGEVLDALEQAHKLEEFYRSRHEKAQAALTPAKEPGKMQPSSRSPQQTGSGRPPAAGPRNLTNRATAATPPKRDRPLTEDERIEEATRALKFRAD